MRAPLLAVALLGSAGCASLHRAVAPIVRVDCATAAVVGLQWTPAPAATYEIVRDGQIVGATARGEFADTAVTGPATYHYGVRVRGAGGGLDGASLTVTTTVPGVAGDAPYCPSTAVSHLRWDFAQAYRAADGSDLWPVTWGRDGRVYAFFGDGGGFGGDDHRGRASFGIATIEGAPPPTAATEHNLYGGYEARYPSQLSGKVRALIAIGSDLYAIAGIFRPSDPKFQNAGPISGSPEHLEMIYSKDGARSWHSSGWTFCASERDEAFCPSGFVNYGRGGAGARGGEVYLYGTCNAADRRRAAGDPGAHTYLARVSRRRLMDAASYEYFAGLDSRSRQVWSSDAARMVPVFTDANSPQPGCGGQCNMAESLEEAVYDAGLKRYVGMAQGEYLAQTSFYESVDPWGPWKTLGYYNIDPHDSGGGWGHLGVSAGGSLGVHAVNAWTSVDGRTLWMVYSSDGVAPPAADFPAPGTKLDAFHLVKVELEP